jgi:hypothetical protein
MTIFLELASSMFSSFLASSLQITLVIPLLFLLFLLNFNFLKAPKILADFGLALFLMTLIDIYALTSGAYQIQDALDIMTLGTGSVIVSLTTCLPLLTVVMNLIYAVTIYGKNQALDNKILFISEVLYTISLVLSPFSIVIVILEHQRLLLLITSSDWFIVPAFIIGLCLYGLRSESPHIYGFIEVVISMVTLWLTIRSAESDLLARSISLLVAVYIMVRGLDNIDKGLPPKYRPIWDRVFPKAVQPQTPGDRGSVSS